MNRKIVLILLALILTPVLFSFKIQEKEKRFRISAIWVKTETAAQEILQKLNKGEKFADLAKAYSVGPEREKGGDLGYFKAGDLLKELNPIATGLAVGEHSGIIKTDLGYFIILKTDELLASAYEQQQQALQQANQLMGKVYYLYQAGKYSEAIPLCEQALPLFEKTLGPEHPEVAVSLMSLARLYETMAAFAKAEPLYQRILAIIEKNFGPEDPAIAMTLNNLAFLYARMGFYAKAEPLYQRALTISEKALGRENQDIGTMLNNLAGLYYSNGALAKAEPLFLRALAIAEKTQGPAHPNVAKSLSNLATLYHSTGFYAKAESLYQRALAIGQRALGPEHPDVAAGFNNLAGLYHSMGAYAKAESLYQRALAILKKTLEPEHLEAAQTLNNLGGLYKTLGAYAKAESLYQQAMKTSEKILGPEHPAMAQNITNLATLYFAMGNYAKAEAMFLRALAIREKGCEPDHPDLARSLTNLASFRQAMGSYDEAETLYERALAILEKTFGPEHPLVAKTLSNRASYYQSRGFPAQADSLYHRASTILEKTLGPEHQDVATNLNNWALLYSSTGFYAKAESLFQRALAINEKSRGPTHPAVASILSNLAQVYSATGAYTQAEHCSKLALAISEKSLGPEHPDMIKCLNDLAFHWAAMNKIDSVRSSAPRLFKLHFNQYHRILPYLPERRQLEFMAINSPLPSLWPSLCLEFGATSHDIQVLSSEVLINNKGLVLELLAARSHEIKLGDSIVAGWRDSLNQVGTQLANLYLSGPKLTSSTAQFMREIQRLGRQQQRLEYALAARGYAPAAKKSPITTSQVSGALRSDEVLIDFWHFQQYHFASPKAAWGNWRYLAYVFQSDHDIAVIDLGAADSIHQSLAELGAAIMMSAMEQIASKQQQAELLFKAQGQQIWQLLFKPLLSVIGEKKKIIICADGLLHYLPFGVLVDEQNHYLVESYQFHYVSTSREILQWKARGKSARDKLSQAVVIADPTFDFAPPQKVVSVAAKSFATEFLTRQLRDWRQMGFSQLKYTRPEAVAIDSLLKQKGIATKLYLQDQAQESVLKSVVSPQILHISTHGFFLPDQPELRKPKEIGGFSSISEFDRMPALENPLLRCGLAFAGANHAELVKEGEDGLATAMEIAGLDLQGYARRGTDLVTLSACLTGVGELRIGEGVYGLHRSFLLAGAKTVLASLWSVPDLETKDLMVEFYRRYLFGENISKSEALRQAQLAVIEQLRKKYGAAPPAYWGAFVCIGEP